MDFDLFSTKLFTDWLFYYVLQSSWEDPDTGKTYSCVDLYFVTQVRAVFSHYYSVSFV